jgi:glycosyltransferase involved in cell wall biosynthesis
VTDDARPIILVVCDYYLPGIRGGGGARTIANMVERMSDRFRFRIICRDRDGRGVSEPYPGVRYGTWNQVGEAEVRYLADGECGARDLIRVVNSSEGSALYFNSVFSRLTLRILFARKLGILKDNPVAIAPCGELGAGALAVKPLRKRGLIALVGFLGLFKGVVWKASSESEVREVRGLLGHVDARIAPDVVASTVGSAALRAPKLGGKLRMVYLSRVTRKKNLLWLIRILRDGPAGVSLDVYGDTDDPHYETECHRAARASIVRFHGVLPHEEVAGVLARYDVLALPTTHENYCHVVREALDCGLPVLISENTPWTSQVNAGAGFAIPLDEHVWKDRIETLRDMDQDAHARLSKIAMEIASANQDGMDVRLTGELLESLVGESEVHR